MPRPASSRSRCAWRSAGAADARGALLLAAVIATALWAASRGSSRRTAPIARTLACCQCLRRAALRVLVRVPREPARRRTGKDGASRVAPLLPRWSIASSRSGAASPASRFRTGLPLVTVARHCARAVDSALRLGLAVVRTGAGRAVAPARALRRRAGHQAAVPGAGRRSSRSTFLLRRRDAVRPRSTPTSGSRAASPTRWSFRSSPSPRRATPAGRSRCTCRAARCFHSTALLVSGVFLLAIAAAGYFVRYFGGDWGRALQIELLFARVLLVLAGRVVGPLPSQAQGLRQQAFLLLPLRLPRGMAAVHAHAVGRGSSQNVERAQRSWRSPTWSKARPARCGSGTTTQAVPAGGALEHAAVDAVGARGWLAAAVPRAHRLGRQPRASTRRSRRGIRDLALPELAAVRRRGAWLVVPLVAGSGVDRIRRPDEPAAADRRQLGGARPAQDRQPAGGELPGPDAGDRGAARSAQVRRLQPDVGLCRARPEEPRGTAVADAQECRAAPRQPRVPAGHADDSRARRRAHEPADAAAAHRRDAGGEAAAGRPRSGRATRLRGQSRRTSARSTSTSTPASLALGHEDRLEHVIGHLVQNALDATAERGQVAVRLDREDDVRRDRGRGHRRRA